MTSSWAARLSSWVVIFMVGRMLVVAIIFRFWRISWRGDDGGDSDDSDDFIRFGDDTCIVVGRVLVIALLEFAVCSTVTILLPG